MLKKELKNRKIEIMPKVLSNVETCEFFIEKTMNPEGGFWLWLKRIAAILQIVSTIVIFAIFFVK